MKEESQKTAIDDFTAMLYRKGYRGKFTVGGKEVRTRTEPQNLSRCLELLLKEKSTGKPFELNTYAPYSDELSCHFTVGFDAVKGFLIKEMTIRDSQSDEIRQYRIAANHQIPGAMSIQGLFPRPKPWERHLKGKFKL